MQAAIANCHTIKDTSGNNMLTQKEKQEGWKLLFDGKNVEWVAYL